MAEIMTTIKNPMPKEGIVDLTKRIKLVSTGKAPMEWFHREGVEINVAPAVAEKYKVNGWAK